MKGIGKIKGIQYFFVCLFLHVGQKVLVVTGLQAYT